MGIIAILFIILAACFYALTAWGASAEQKTIETINKNQKEK
jgi:hypothetical protein